MSRNHQVVACHPRCALSRITARAAVMSAEVDFRTRRLTNETTPILNVRGQCGGPRSLAGSGAPHEDIGTVTVRHKSLERLTSSLYTTHHPISPSMNGETRRSISPTVSRSARDISPAVQRTGRAASQSRARLQRSRSRSVQAPTVRAPSVVRTRLPLTDAIIVDEVIEASDRIQVMVVGLGMVGIGESTPLPSTLRG